MYAIETKGLTKKYGQLTAVDHMDLKVEEGELFALLGVNGAGKTTAIRMMCCLSSPAEGEAFICGKSCLTEKEAVKAVIGISPQDTAVADNLTVLENLLFMAKVHGADASEAKARANEVMQMLRLEEVAQKRAKTLSGGWKRKLSIGMALIGKPKVLFLDEPTLGLDVLARRELWQTIEGLKGKVTILLTTHYMEEAQRLSDRIAVMIAGRLEALGTLEQLEAETGKQGLEEAFVAIAERRMQNA